MRGCNTSYSLINITQYENAYSLDIYYGANITVYVNLRNYYTLVNLAGATGNLTFNGSSYSYTDVLGTGIYDFSNINTSAIPVANGYTMTISFNLTNYKNETFIITFNILERPVVISVFNAPSSVELGGTLEIEFKMTNQLNGDPIVGETLRITVDWGDAGSAFQDRVTAASIGGLEAATANAGIASFSLPVPLTATKINIDIDYFGANGTLQSFSFEYDLITLDQPSVEPPTTPPAQPMDPLLLILILLGVIGGVVVGVVVAKGRGKTNKKVPAKKLALEKAAELEGALLKVSIEELRANMKVLIAEANALIKGGYFAQAGPKYKEASIIASSVFKLGDTNAGKEVKRLSNLARDCELKATTQPEELKGPRAVVKFDELKKGEKKKSLGVKTIVIEQEGAKKELFKGAPAGQKQEAGLESIPIKTRDRVESIVLKLLYQEKSVKTQKILIDKILEIAVTEKVTVSEKNVRLIVDQMRKEKKIQFNQKEGWKIQI